jgi:hypothetical protein
MSFHRHRHLLPAIDPLAANVSFGPKADIRRRHEFAVLQRLDKRIGSSMNAVRTFVTPRQRARRLAAIAAFRPRS